MLFFTILFIIMNIMSLVDSNWLQDWFFKMGNDFVKLEKMKINSDGSNYLKNKDIKELETKLGIKAIVLMVFGIALLIIEIIYLVNAIHIDPLRIPTIFMIGYFIFNLVTSRKNNKQFDNYDENDLIQRQQRLDYFEEQLKKSKKHNFIYYIKAIVNLSYYIYMFICLM